MRRFHSLQTQLSAVLCTFLVVTFGALGVFLDAVSTRAIEEQTRSREALFVHNVQISINQVLFAGKYQAQAYVETLMQPPGELLYVAVVDATTRRVLAHSEPGRVGEQWHDAATTQALEAWRTGAVTSQELVGADGGSVHDWAAPYLRGYLKHPEGIIRVGLSGAREASLIRETRLYTLAVMLLFLLAGAALAIALSVRLTSSLKALTDTTRRFGEGDYTAAVAIAGAPRDELEQLGAAFNHMAVRLGEYAANIERQVEERTSQLQQVDRRLRESEARLQTFIAHANTVMYMKDPEGRYILVNPGFEEVSGRLRPDILGKSDFELWPADQASHFRADDQRVLASGVPHAYEETLDFAGQRRVFLSVKFPMRDDEGRIVALGGISTDITERKRLEEMLQAQFLKLKELDALKNEFVNAVSHDLRTPLTSILGYSEFLEDGIGGDLSAQQRDFVGQIQKAAHRLEGLVDDLLDMARIDAGTFKLRCEPGDLRDVVHEIAASLLPLAEEAHLTLSVDVPDKPLTAVYDARRIQQVLTNLVHNALKFTPSGGSVRVVARRVAAGVRIEVVDTGPGISAEDQQRLFQRFSQLQVGMAKGGTGLGLSISKAIVEAHGGTIGVESEPERGASFWILLPEPPTAC